MPPKANQAGGKDIRKFFTSISPKGAPTNSASASRGLKESNGHGKKKALVISDSDEDDGPFLAEKGKTQKPSQETEKKVVPAVAQKKKPRMVISDSDDEEDPFIKPKKEVASSKPVSVKQETRTKLKKTEETPLKAVDIKSVFGDSPIQRSKDLPDKRKRKLEEHAEPDFNETLRQLDEEQTSKKLKVSGPSSAEKSAVVVKKEKVTPEKKSPRESKVKTPEKSPKDSAKLKEARTKTPEKDSRDLAKLKEKSKPEKLREDKIKKEPSVIFESPAKEQDVSIMEATPPPFDPLEKRKQKAENYRKFLASHKEGAKNPGCKEVPQGAEGCFEGVTVVVTGVLESLHRNEAEDLVKKYGGKVTQAVSSKTTYLLAGEDAGPSKLSKARDLKVTIINEDEFLDLIATRPAGVGNTTPAKGRTKSNTPAKGRAKAASPVAVARETTPKKNSGQEAAVKLQKSPKSIKVTKSEKDTSVANAEAVDIATVRKDDSAKSGNDIACLPWVDKYKPTSVKQIIGQQGDRSNAKKLMYWIQNWHANHSGNKKLTRPSPWATNDDGSYFKAALLSGPPGIGKTTTAHLVSRELGFDVVEFNASDTRSKRLLHEQVSELVSSYSLAAFAHGDTSRKDSKKRVLIMDEVDGMAGNEDRGGVQELIHLIKTSRVPVICICNDRQHPKIRSLANYCYDLKFARPRMEQIRGAMMSICFKEGVKMNPQALDEIVQGANQDVRQILHHLSVLGSREKSMTNEQAKMEAAKSKKDLKFGPWDVVKKVFSKEEHATMSIHDKCGLFFQDYSLGPLFVQENYLQVVPAASRGSVRKTLDLLSLAADSIAQADLMEKVVRSQNAWSLLPAEAIFASVVPGQLLEGHVGGQIQFPSWLGKNSKQKKIDRLLQELQLHMRLKISASKQALNLDYVGHLVNAVVGPLRRDGQAGVEQAVQVMNDYYLAREDLESLIEVAHWPGKQEIMSGIDGKVKAAFTRTYNKNSHMAPYAMAAVKATRSRASANDDPSLADEDPEAEEDGAGEDDDEDADDIGHDAMIKVKTKKKTAAAAASSSTTTKKAAKQAAPAKTSRTTKRNKT